VRFTTSQSADFGRDIVEAIDSVPALCDHVAPAGAIGIDASAAGNAADVHAGRIPREDCADPLGAPLDQRDFRHHRQ